MSYEFNNTDDTIDVRDVIERFEELENARDDYTTENSDGYQTIIGADWSRGNPEDAAELAALQSLLADMAGNGGDEQWRGDWYPVTLIRGSYFETAMDEMLEDCGDLPKDLPCYLSITVDYKALQMDYTSAEIDGVTYWYR